MKVLMMLAMILGLVACGKKHNDDTCHSKAYMQNVCVNQMTPIYGYPYSVAKCSDQYFQEKCY